MLPTAYRDDILPQDIAQDDSSLEPGTAQPLSSAELDDLLYGEGRSTEERLQLLREMRDNIGERDGGNVGDNDPEDLIATIDDRIAELEGGEVVGEEAGALDIDPLAHRETLSPDSDELEELEDEDEESLEDDDDEDDDLDEDDDDIDDDEVTELGDEDDLDEEATEEDLDDDDLDDEE